MDFFIRHLTPRAVRLAILGLMAVVLLVLVLATKPWQVPAQGDAIARSVAISTWWAGAANLILLGLLAASTRWWLRPRYLVERSSPRLPAGFSMAVGGAMLVCAILGAVRLDDSLWHDEEYSVRRAILGTYRIKSDEVKLRELPWAHTFWSYRKPTNHILQSVLSRLSLSAWRMTARPSGLQINEIAVRLPSYLAGVLSVGALALMLARAGLPWPGVAAAWLLALHPWHVKLAPEARGYAFVFLFLSLIALCAIQALDSGRWRWWLGLALSELLLLWTWPPAVFAVVGLNVCLAAMILTGPRPAGIKLLQAGRWLASGVLAVMALLQLLLPCLPQLQDYANSSQGFDFHDNWRKNVGSLMLFGAYWSKTGLTAASPYWEMLPQAVANPALVPASIFLAVLFLALGASTVWRTPPHGRWLTLFFLLPGALLFLIASARGLYLFEWYLAMMLPGLVALVAAGIFSAGNFLARVFSRREVPLIFAVIVVAAFTLLTWTNRAYLLRGSTQSYRESVLLTRPQPDPNAPENSAILTAGTLLLPDVYDPRIRKAQTIDDYAAIMEEAEARSIPLFINNGFPDILQDLHPDIHALLADPAVFDLIARLPGNEPLLDRTIHKYRPGSLRKVDRPRSPQTGSDPAARGNSDHLSK